MNADELLKLLDAGDLHGAMLGVVRMWLERYYAESLGLGVFVWVHADLPPVRITIPASASASSPAPVAPVPPTPGSP